MPTSMDFKNSFYLEYLFKNAHVYSEDTYLFGYLRNSFYEVLFID